MQNDYVEDEPNSRRKVRIIWLAGFLGLFLFIICGIFVKEMHGYPGRGEKQGQPQYDASAAEIKIITLRAEGQHEEAIVLCTKTLKTLRQGGAPKYQVSRFEKIKGELEEDMKAKHDEPGINSQHNKDNAAAKPQTE